MSTSRPRPSILVDGSLLLGADQTGIASFTRSLSRGLCGLGAEVGLLLSSPAQLVRGAPSIALADQVFAARRPPEKGLRASLTASFRRVWDTRAGFRRKLAALPVPLDGIELAALTPVLPPHDSVFNASSFLQHAQAVFAMRGRFTEIAVEAPIDAVHWTVPAPVMVRRRPNIYTVHDLIPLKFPQFTTDVGGRAATVHGILARTADHILTMSERSRDDIKAILGVPDERISVVYQPAPPMPALDRDESERLVASLYGAKPGEYVFFCGAIEPKKNLLRLIEAFSIAGTGKQLLIAGPLGWLYDDILTMMSNTSGSGVRYLGYLPRRHIVALMQCASFFAFPSIYEGFGIPVLEAMQLGTPVLTSHGGSLPEVVGDAAVMVDPLDVTALTAAIRQMAADGDLRQDLARRGRERAPRFSPDAFAAQLRTVYARIGISFPTAASGSAQWPDPGSSVSAPSCAPPQSTPLPGGIPALTPMPTSTSAT